MEQHDLGDGYVLREMSKDEFWPICRPHMSEVFKDSLHFWWRQHIPPLEFENFQKLEKNMGPAPSLHFSIYKDDQFAGWSVGDQKSGEVYYMRNSAILPEHRRRGLYSRLLKTKIDVLKAMGYQKIYSRHTATNNAVLIPKLKAGFLLTSMEVDDVFGVLVHLTYYTNPLRRKMMDFRVGELRPDDEINKVLELSKA